MEAPKALSIQSLATMVFTGVMVWCGNRIADTWRESGATSAVAAAVEKATAELRTQLISCRNRELDDVKMRLHDVERQGR